MNGVGGRGFFEPDLGGTYKGREETGATDRSFSRRLPRPTASPVFEPVIRSTGSKSVSEISTKEVDVCGARGCAAGTYLLLVACEVFSDLLGGIDVCWRVGVGHVGRQQADDRDELCVADGDIRRVTSRSVR